ncbi:MAG: adenylyl-sulfate kinase [Desulfovibrio sp.]|jgi:adenylyl-sulfate kinase|nr:adenylyl-sulfate kinase [Desulfovibrio sp.]
MSSDFRLVIPRSHVNRDMREARQPHRGMVFWLTGLSGSGKSTLAHRAEESLFARGYNIFVLDGDVIRRGLCRDLGFSPEDRTENNRRAAELARLFMLAGAVCLCAFISPQQAARQQAREIVGGEFFREVYVACSLEECERRDVKGFYRKAREGSIPHYTGVSADYEVPASPDLTISTEAASEAQSAGELIAFIASRAGKNTPGR